MNTIKSTYNKHLVNEARKFGGIWIAKEKHWQFSELVSDEVKELNEKYNTNLVIIEAKAKEEIRQLTGSVLCFGYMVAFAFNRDSGAKVGENAALISGEIKSGGSAKNWCTIVEKDSVFKICVSLYVLNNFSDKNWEIKVLN